MRRTTWSVELPEDDEGYRIRDEGRTVKTIRSSYSLDEVLASAERKVLDEWGDVLVFLQRQQHEGLPIVYEFYVQQ